MSAAVFAVGVLLRFSRRLVLLFLFFILCGIGFILLSLEHDREQKERIRQTIRQMGRENGS